MKEVGLFNKATGIAAAAVALMTAFSAVPAFAQTSNTIFPEGWDRSVRDRMFMRLGYIAMDPKTKSSEVYDVTGPVIAKGELTAYAQNADLSALTADQSLAVTSAATRLDRPFNPGPGGALAEGFNNPNWAGTRYENGLGTPGGIKSKIGNSGTPAVSIGFYLTEEYTWALEAFLLGLPMKIKAYGDGTREDDGAPLGLSGHQLISAKMLPPTFLLGRYFGDKNAKLRPYLGVGGAYAIFFDAKTTNFLDTYVGGKTTVALKNSMGWGGFAGLQYNITDATTIGLNLGLLKLKSQATLTTRNTIMLGEGDLADRGVPSVLRDYPLYVRRAMFAAGPSGSGVTLGNGREVINLTDLTEGLAILRQAEGRAAPGDGIGTYVRKQNIDVTSKLFMLTVGHSF
jgi:outer membrane protein